MICSDVGKFTHDPELINDNGVDKLNFTLAVEHFRKNKTGDKIRNVDYFNFVAFDSGARTLSSRCQKGDLMWFEARPVQYRWLEDEVKKSKTVFRMERFRVLNSNSNYNEDDNENNSD